MAKYITCTVHDLLHLHIHGTKVDGIPTPQHQGANTVIKKL